VIRDLLWKGYALLYVGLLVIGMAVSYRQETWTVTDYVSAGFAAIYLVGLAGHAYRTPILRRRFWRVMFWLLVVGLVSMGALVFLAQSPDAPDATLLSLLFTLPLAVALHAYSAAGNPLWTEMELLSKAQALDRKLGATGMLEATHTGKVDGRETHTAVTVSRHHQGYAIDISRTIDGTEQRSSDTVGDPRALIRAIEMHTPLRIADFRPRT
jgi:hypothetical protein